MRIIGRVDPAETKLCLEFLLDEKVIGRCVADQYRQDLEDASLGNGHCAFAFPTPAFIPKRDINKIVVRLENSSVLLPIDAAKSNGSSTSAEGDTISRFGGLWIDRLIGSID